MIEREETCRLRVILSDHPEVTSVSNALVRYGSEQETQAVPNILAFDFRGHQFFARIHRNVILAKPEKDALPSFVAEVPLADFGDRLTSVLTPLLSAPIVVTREGDVIRGEDGMEDIQWLTHVVCGGVMDVRDTTPTHRAAHCRLCGLRVIFPRTIQVFRDLRTYFEGIYPPRDNG